MPSDQIQEQIFSADRGGFIHRVRQMTPDELWSEVYGNRNFPRSSNSSDKARVHKMFCWEFKAMEEVVARHRKFKVTKSNADYITDMLHLLSKNLCRFDHRLFPAEWQIPETTVCRQREVEEGRELYMRRERLVDVCVQLMQRRVIWYSRADSHIGRAFPEEVKEDAPNSVFHNAHRFFLRLLASAAESLCLYRVHWEVSTDDDAIGPPPAKRSRLEESGESQSVLRESLLRFIREISPQGFRQMTGTLQRLGPMFNRPSTSSSEVVDDLMDPREAELFAQLDHGVDAFEFRTVETLLKEARVVEIPNEEQEEAVVEGQDEYDEEDGHNEKSGFEEVQVGADHVNNDEGEENDVREIPLIDLTQSDDEEAIPFEEVEVDTDDNVSVREDAESTEVLRNVHTPDASRTAETLREEAGVVEEHNEEQEEEEVEGEDEYEEVDGNNETSGFEGVDHVNNTGEESVRGIPLIDLTQSDDDEEAIPVEEVEDIDQVQNGGTDNHRGDAESSEVLRNVDTPDSEVAAVDVRVPLERSGALGAIRNAYSFDENDSDSDGEEDREEHGALGRIRESYSDSRDEYELEEGEILDSSDDEHADGESSARFLSDTETESPAPDQVAIEPPELGFSPRVERKTNDAVLQRLSRHHRPERRAIYDIGRRSDIVDAMFGSPDYWLVDNLNATAAALMKLVAEKIRRNRRDMLDESEIEKMARLQFGSSQNPIELKSVRSFVRSTMKGYFLIDDDGYSDVFIPQEFRRFHPDDDKDVPTTDGKQCLLQTVMEYWEENEAKKFLEKIWSYCRDIMDDIVRTVFVVERSSEGELEFYHTGVYDVPLRYRRQN